MFSPNRRHRSVLLAPALLAVVLGGAWLTATAGDEKRKKRARAEAVALYDAGSYEEARARIEALDEQGMADGALLYRLYYCQREAGMSEARRSLVRARETLEGELAEARGIEVPFYLVNAYRNSGRPGDMQRVAGETVARIEDGSWPEPERPTEMYWLARMYADLERGENAERWFVRTTEVLGAEDQAPSPYLGLAGRYLGSQAFERGEHAAADRYYSLWAKDASAVADLRDLDRLAIARARLGRYEDASAAWNAALRIDPARGDHPRYCAALARLAGETPELPQASPDGRPWSDLQRAELESLMLEQAGEVRSIRGEIAPGTQVTPARRTELQRRLDGVRPIFLRTALEYAMRGLPIRETAFQSGYAPLIFRGSDWRIPRPQRPGLR